MRKQAAALMAALLLAGALPAAADGVLQVDASVTDTVTTAEVFVNVTCPASGKVTAYVTDEHGAVCYEGIAFGAAGSFSTGDLYLPLQGGNTCYYVDISSDSGSWRVTVHRTQPRLTGIRAYAAGYPLSAVSGRAGGLWTVLLDPAQGVQQVPLLAGGLYRLGTVSLTCADGMVTAGVTMEAAANAVCTESRVSVAGSAEGLVRLARGEAPDAKGALGEAIPVGDASPVAVCVELTVSFDPAALECVGGDPAPGQEELWQRLVELDPDGVFG